MFALFPTSVTVLSLPRVYSLPFFSFFLKKKKAFYDAEKLQQVPLHHFLNEQVFKNETGATVSALVLF